MQVSKDRSLGRQELLYDRERLRMVRDEYGPATEIKHAVDTPAFIYEIRTALRYWFGGNNNHRANDEVWARCEAVEEGRLHLDGDELVYPEVEA